jgi:hypothetical protein
VSVFPEQSFSFELGQFLLQKEMTTCFFACFCEGDSFQQGSRFFAFSVTTACCWMLQDVLPALCMYIFGEINASNLFRGSSIGVFFFENQNTDLPL